jgi:hypothetical protein
MKAEPESGRTTSPPAALYWTIPTGEYRSDGTRTSPCPESRLRLHPGYHCQTSPLADPSAFKDHDADADGVISAREAQESTVPGAHGARLSRRSSTPR